MNVSHEFFKGHDHNSKEFRERCDELKAMCRRLVSSYGLEKIAADDLFQETLYTLWVKPHRTAQVGTNWQAYVWGVARNLALEHFRSRGLLSQKWTRVILDMPRTESEFQVASPLEEILGDGTRSSDEAFSHLEAQIRYDQWQLACIQRLDQIIIDETLKLTPEALFKRFVEMIWHDGCSERAAWRMLVHSEFERVSQVVESPHPLAAFSVEGLSDVEIWNEMDKLGMTRLKAFQTFNRYFQRLKWAVRQRWQAEQLPIPDDLRLGYKDSPFQQMWKQAAIGNPSRADEREGAVTKPLAEPQWANRNQTVVKE